MSAERADWIRVGNRIVNLAHVVTVDLDFEGDVVLQLDCSESLPPETAEGERITERRALGLPTPPDSSAPIDIMPSLVWFEGKDAEALRRFFASAAWIVNVTKL